MLKRLDQLLAVVFLFVVGLSLVVVVIGASSILSVETVVAEYEEVYVQPGETAWQLCARFNSNIDIRDAVELFRDANGSIDIVAGEIVRVPVVK